MRYYLDTNILVFLWTGELDNLCHEVQRIIGDYENTLLVSSVCAMEFMHLFHIGKFSKKQQAVAGGVEDLIKRIDEMGVNVVHTTDFHLRIYNTLPVHTETHRDPIDSFIIAQAIADRIPLISSDRKFTFYESDGLHFVFNKR